MKQPLGKTTSDSSSPDHAPCNRSLHLFHPVSLGCSTGFLTKTSSYLGSRKICTKFSWRLILESLELAIKVGQIVVSQLMRDDGDPLFGVDEELASVPTPQLNQVFAASHKGMKLE